MVFSSTCLSKSSALTHRSVSKTRIHRRSTSDPPFEPGKFARIHTVADQFEGRARADLRRARGGVRRHVPPPSVLGVAAPRCQVVPAGGRLARARGRVAGQGAPRVFGSGAAARAPRARHRGRGRDARGLDRRAQRRRRALRGGRLALLSLAGARGGGSADGARRARGEPPPRRRRISAPRSAGSSGARARGGPRATPRWTPRLNGWTWMTTARACAVTRAGNRGDAGSRDVPRRRVRRNLRGARPGGWPSVCGDRRFLPARRGEARCMPTGTRTARCSGRAGTGRAGTRGYAASAENAENGGAATANRGARRAVRRVRLRGQARRGRVAWTPRTTTRSRPSPPPEPRGRLFRRSGARRRRVWGVAGRAGRQARLDARGRALAARTEAATEVASRLCTAATRAGSARSFGSSPGGRYQFRPSPPPRRARRRRRAAPRRAPPARRGTSAATSSDGPSATDVFASPHPGARRWRTSGRTGCASRSRPACSSRSRACSSGPRRRRRTLEALGETDFHARAAPLRGRRARRPRAREYNARGAKPRARSSRMPWCWSRCACDSKPRSRTPERSSPRRPRSEAAAAAFRGGGGLFGGGGGFGARSSSSSSSSSVRRRAPNRRAGGSLGRHRDALPARRAPARRAPPVAPGDPAGVRGAPRGGARGGLVRLRVRARRRRRLGLERWSGDLPNDAQLVCYLFCAF